MELNPNTASSPWRLIRSAPANGAWNMALDEAILESVGRKQSPPTLRLYAWEPPCLSLGYAQSIRDVNLEALQQNGWQLVRRPTGGRAILHADELTYAVIAPLTEPILAGSVMESYCRLAQALLHALHILGLPAEANEKHDNPVGTQPNGPVCFEVPSNYEITVHGRKLIGSAQARRVEGVLQHGSLPLHGDISRITRALAYPTNEARDQAARRLLQRATTVERVLHQTIAWEQAAAAFVQGFEQALHLELIPGEPTPAEIQRAGELLTEKYANKAWVARS